MSKNITQKQLDDAVKACKADTKSALELIFSNLNHGQTQKLLKEPSVKELVERYGVQIEE